MCISALVLLGGAALIVEGSGAATTPTATTGSTAASANSQTFVDFTGDNRGGSPDITTVQVSNDDDGLLEFRIAIPNRTDLTDADFVSLNLDTDQSDTTGCNVGAGIGVDWAVTFVGHTEPVSDFFLLLRYESCERDNPDFPQSSLSASFDRATSTLVVRVDRAQVGTPASFRFFVASNAVPIRPDTYDLAGDRTPWTYQVLVSPSKDRAVPRVKALPSSGVRGKVAKLRYSVFDESGRAREEVTIFRGRRALAKVRTRLGMRSVTRIYATLWRVPAGVVGSLKFCVRAWDGAGNRSAQSCAQLTIR